jgi:Ribonuclease G/E
VRQSLSQSVTQTCPTCGGLGLIQTVETAGLVALRRLKAAVTEDKVAALELKLSPAVAQYVQNQMRRRLTDIERETGKRITVVADEALDPGRVELRCFKAGGEEVVLKR